MWNKTRKFLFILRKQLVLIFTISFYMLSIYYFFINHNILIWLLFSIFFFVLAHYFIIELKKTDIWNLILLVVVVLLINLGFIGFNNIFYTIALIVFHLGVLFLFFDVYEEVYNRITINSWKVFTMGAKMYSLVLSFVFSLAFLGTYRTFNLTCPQIYNFIQKASVVASNYLGISVPKIDHNVKVKEVISNLSTGNVQQQYTWLKLSYLIKPDFWKYAIVNQIMSNKKILDKNICQIIVSNIKEKYTKPGFQFAVMFLIFMLFYPLIRLVIIILAIINWFLFQLARLAHIYRYKKVVEEVEVLE